MPGKHEAKLRELFAAADTSGDGQLTIQELNRVLKNAGCQMSDAEIASCFANDDTNQDQRISVDEFIAANNKRDPNTVKEEELRCCFNEMDKDKSGFLDERDFMSCMKGSLPDDQIQQMIADVDKNSDGKIAFDEFLTMWKSKLC